MPREDVQYEARQYHFAPRSGDPKMTARAAVPPSAFLRFNKQLWRATAVVATLVLQRRNGGTAVKM